MDKDYSLDALGKFLDYAANKGLIKPNTASSRKRAALKILGILDDDEKKDIRQVDVEQTFDRFTNLHGHEFKPASLQVFKSRLKAALKDFEVYVQDPATFKPASSQRTSPKSSSESNSTNPSAKSEDNSGGEATKRKTPPQPDPTHLVLPIPLRPGLTLTISGVPPDLSTQEADKVAAIIKAYAMNET